jgi:hypothetical protein
MRARHVVRWGGWGQAWLWWCRCGDRSAGATYPSEPAARLAAHAHLVRVGRGKLPIPTSLRPDPDLSAAVWIVPQTLSEV